MTRPRKEQIQDLKAKYTRVNSVGTLSSFGWDNSASNSGLATQTLVDSVGNLQYTDFVNASLTKETDGADSPSPPVVYGGFGPFTVVNGQQFTITIPGVNAGNPITVTIQTSDLVTLGGSSVLTTSRAAKMINTRLATQGVSYEVAKNINGQLVLFGADASGLIYGDDAFLTLSDVSAGVLSALGFAGSPASSVGITGPKRGIVTRSADGFGGTAFLRSVDGSAALVPTRVLYHVGGWRYVEDAQLGQPVYARVVELPGSKIRLSYFRKGVVQARILANGGNLTTLSGTDIFTVTVAGPDTGTQVLTVNFGGGVATVSDVVTTFNAVWAATTLSSGSIEATRASLLCAPGPYAFSGDSSFRIAFNGTADITITPSATDTTPTALAATINAAISSAGLTAQGTAIVTTPSGLAPTVQIRSLSTDPSVSKITIKAGNTTPPDLQALRKLNLSPGIYCGSSIIQAYGADEIRFQNPGRGLGNAITVASNSLSMGRLGLTGTSVTAASAAGDEEVGPPQSHLLLQEVMEFGEVPNNYDQRIEDFDAKGPQLIRPDLGINNAGLGGQFDATGLLKDLLSHLKFLSADELKVGENATSSTTKQAKPRISGGYNSSTGAVLLQEFSDVAGSSAPTRHYLKSGSLIITINAKLNIATNVWSKDVNGARSVRLELSQAGGLKTLYRASSDDTTWVDTAWLTGTRSIAANSSVDAGGYPDQTIFFTAAAITLALPDPAANANRQIWLIDKSNALDPSAAVTLTRFGSETINGVAANYDLTTPRGRWRLYSDGTDWFLFTSAETAISALNSSVATLNATIAALQNTRTLTTTATLNTPNKDATIFLVPGASFNLTLPLASTATGQRVLLINTTGNMSSTNKVTLVRSGGALINNYAGNFDLEAAYGRWWLTCDGTNWHVAQM